MAILHNPVIPCLFDLLEDYGTRYIICSPGSRNASLLAEADNRDSLNKLVIQDERSAAFVALGIAMVSQKPVALICTSGTALLNYSPALAEAYYQGIPLIAISADRPMEWIDQDDSQTIRQPNVYSKFIKASYDLDASVNREDYLWFANRVINEGLIKACTGKRGPVHFNIHITGEPLLYNQENRSASRKIELIKQDSHISRNDLVSLVSHSAGKKIMLVVGFLPPNNKLQKGIATLAKLRNVAVFAETISNVHLDSSDYLIDSCLFGLEEKDEIKGRPDILISCGGAIISRKLKEFLRKVKPREHWNIGMGEVISDCYQSLTLQIMAEPEYFFLSFAKRLSNYQNKLDDIVNFKGFWSSIRKKMYPDIGGWPWCDLTALNILLNHIPQNTNLFLSNGTSIRYAQIISYNLPHASFCNRGVSGIEGSTSTALGGSLVYRDLTLLVTGDMSFAYDLNALSSPYCSKNFRIAILNNGGGDIFRFINATTNLPIREKYLCADPQTDIRKVAEAFGWNYCEADSKETLGKCLPSFFGKSDRPVILNIKTPKGELNSEILKKFLRIKH